MMIDDNGCGKMNTTPKRLPDTDNNNNNNDDDDDNNAIALPIQLQIRQIIFEKFNDPDLRFTNDQIFDELQKRGAVDDSCDICDIESEFNQMCKSGLARNIAQNFNTIWLKIFDVLEEVHCISCSNTIHLAKSEDSKCPNPECGAVLK